MRELASIKWLRHKRRNASNGSVPESWPFRALTSCSHNALATSGFDLKERLVPEPLE
jgi:hypothetical protein